MAVLYFTVSPSLNPLICTLRDKDVKATLTEVLTFLAEKTISSLSKSIKCWLKETENVKLS